jgi:hypothetical protein
MVITSRTPIENLTRRILQIPSQGKFSTDDSFLGSVLHITALKGYFEITDSMNMHGMNLDSGKATL